MHFPSTHKRPVLLALLFVLALLMGAALFFSWQGGMPVVVALLGGSLVVLLVAGLFLFRLTSGVDEAIIRLADMVQHICQRKDFSLRAATELHGPTMDSLTSAINQLLDEIVAREGEMVKLQDHLESRVATRTAALQEINSRLRHEKKRADNAAMVKSDFLANMSHEIRTPMNGIIAACDLANEEVVSPKVGNYLKIIQESSHALLLVVRDILDFSRLEAGNMVLAAKVFTMTELVNGVEETFRHKAVQEHLDFVVERGEDVPEFLVGDIIRLRQIVDNLVDNGLKFTKSGSVTVQFSCRSMSDQEVGLHIKVTDTGIGLAKASSYRVFEAFHQEDSSMTREFGGTGLGLAISKRLAKMMGGTITVTGEPGKGSVFTVQVRLGWQAASPEQDDLPAGPVEVGDEDITYLAGLHILLVEDNEINRGIAEAMLTSMGITVDTAVNGKLGVDKFALHRYDAILMDMQMPVMDGYTAIAKIRGMEKGKTIPIIALTAHALDYDRDRCLQAGADSYVSKPVKRQQVLRELAHFFAAARPAAKASLLPVAGKDESGGGDDIVDRQAAISRLGVTASVYKHVVETFCADYQSFPARLAEALAQHDLETVRVLVHSLKGSGSTVGAENLAQEARLIEDGCKGGKLPEAERVEHLLRSLAEVIGRFCPTGGGGEIVSEDKGAVEIKDQGKLVASLHELADSLDQSMYDTINTSFQAVAENIVAPQVAQLEQMIRMYKYDEALQLVQEMLDDLPDGGR